ncbi:hypothetical protein D9757_011017 [Collybiopsis confluens]|uniref:Uncharacterized protein n=1 Tax=Collybiopsis confluens TaxID=2823264 RepID=A0A8H5GD87_9AGAR|nr:hypothetical protein D9757_011017 [Collybiopsis confluens]
MNLDSVNLYSRPYQISATQNPHRSKKNRQQEVVKPPPLPFQSFKNYGTPLKDCLHAYWLRLTHQISAQFEALGSAIGVRCAVIIGGEVDRVTQAVALMKKPHIIVATPGRLADHLKATKGFSLRQLKFMPIRLLDLDFGVHINQVLDAVPKDRTTYLFSATMNTQVSQLQRASLTNSVRVETAAANHTVDTLLQYYVFYPIECNETLLAYIVSSQVLEKEVVHFSIRSCRFNIMLRLLGFSVVPLHGDLSQSQRTGALSKFKSGERKVLVATDVASRGLDIPAVDLVLNYDMPLNLKDYIHRVGRATRAGRAGKAILFTTQYDVEFVQRLETALGKNLVEWETSKEDVVAMLGIVDEAGQVAAREVREEEGREGIRGNERMAAVVRVLRRCRMRALRRLRCSRFLEMASDYRHFTYGCGDRSVGLSLGVQIISRRGWAHSDVGDVGGKSLFA